MKKNNEGFSLVEVLLAMVLLAAIVIPTCTSLVLSFRMNAKAEALMQAQLAVSSAVETLMAEGIRPENIGQDGVYTLKVASGSGELPTPASVFIKVKNETEEETETTTTPTASGQTENSSVTTPTMGNQQGNTSETQPTDPPVYYQVEVSEKKEDPLVRITTHIRVVPVSDSEGTNGGKSG